MSNEVTVHYQLLPRHDSNNDKEIRRYSCSECPMDVFNINVHAQYEHDTLIFDISPEEKAREADAPFHPCGILGCDFPPHETGPHSWQSNVPEETSEVGIQKVNGEV
jgi:hypothetical protein